MEIREEENEEKEKFQEENGLNAKYGPSKKLTYPMFALMMLL